MRGSRVRSGVRHHSSAACPSAPSRSAARSGSWASRNSSCSVATRPERSARPSHELAVTRAPLRTAWTVLARPRPRSLCRCEPSTTPGPAAAATRSNISAVSSGSWRPTVSARSTVPAPAAVNPPAASAIRPWSAREASARHRSIATPSSRSRTLFTRSVPCASASRAPRCVITRAIASEAGTTASTRACATPRTEATACRTSASVPRQTAAAETCPSVSTATRRTASNSSAHTAGNPAANTTWRGPSAPNTAPCSRASRTRKPPGIKVLACAPSRADSSHSTRRPASADSRTMSRISDPLSSGPHPTAGARRGRGRPFLVRLRALPAA